MKLVWLYDFLALVEYESFSRAAQARHVTQPAFSRRIRALEHWLHADLVDRAQYPVALTGAGQLFIDKANELITHIELTQSEMKSLSKAPTRISIAIQQSLAVSFLPQWLALYQPILAHAQLQIEAENLHDMIERFLAGRSDFLLSYALPDLIKRLEQEGLCQQVIGKDCLLPVQAADKVNNPPIILQYPAQTFLGRAVAREGLTESDYPLQYGCENVLADSLKAMVLVGQGMAWLPQSLIQKELDQAQLIILDKPFQIIDLNIVLYRLPQERTPLVEQLWQAVLANN